MFTFVAGINPECAFSCVHLDVFKKFYTVEGSFYFSDWLKAGLVGKNELRVGPFGFGFFVD